MQFGGINLTPRMWKGVVGGLTLHKLMVIQDEVVNDMAKPYRSRLCFLSQYLQPTQPISQDQHNFYQKDVNLKT